MNKCPICQTATVDGALYCHMCGVSLKDAQRKLQESMRSGQLPLYRHAFTAFGEQKTVEVWCHDITTFPQDFDLLTVSAFPNNYNTTARSLIGALWRNLGINVGELLTDPFIDLRPQIGCWLSRPLPASSTGGLFTHIGCITLGGSEIGKGSIISRIRSYFHMLDLAADADVPMETILVPLIGTGDQNIQADQILLPLMNEVVSLLKRNNKVKKLLFVERNYEKASMAADALRKSYQLSYAPAENTAKPLNKEPYFFLSYTTHGDTYAAELFRDELRRRGLRYWYAPDSIRSGDYASQIVEGIRKCTHFVCLISRNTSNSYHVVNELDLAFNRLGEGVSILPFMLESNNPGDSLSYYISRMQWSLGYPDPLPERISEFLDKILPATAI